ncbi:MAG: DUF2935 domain-containing protein [Negativicutes bacterium]|nr:DUF2935 domain-containing protein [Negativicutes bacterium]
MSLAKYEQSALFEHRFWLQILGDHARFVFHSLSPVEHQPIKEASRFIQHLDQLLCEARESGSSERLREITGTAFETTKELRCFKLELLRRHLVGEISTSLPPTFFNHMLNELEEYLRVLECLLAKEIPVLAHPIHHHLLWVSDAVLHSETLAARVDPAESKLKETSECFVHDFKELYLKAVELKGYLRTAEERFPALTRYHFQVEKEILNFDDFLCKLLNLLNRKMALGTLTPLIPDHMLREECYFLTKLAQVTEIKMPKCDPTKPRIMD